MNQQTIERRLFGIARPIFGFVTGATALLMPIWGTVILAFFIVMLVHRPLADQLSPQFRWGVIVVAMIFNGFVWHHVYSKFPNRYPNEVMAFTTGFMKKIQDGSIEEARALTKMRSPYHGTEEGFADTAFKLPSTELELEALVYVGASSGDYARYEINFLTEDTQVVIEVGHPLDDPSTLWVQGMYIQPMSEYVKPPTTYWMRGERYLK